MYNDAKVTDHHAIIPTGNYAALSRLNDRERRLFDLVARRLLSMHYPDYEYESARIETRVGEDTFLSTGFEGGRHAKRVDMITAIEKKYNK